MESHQLSREEISNNLHPMSPTTGKLLLNVYLTNSMPQGSKSGQLMRPFGQPAVLLFVLAFLVF